jgi:hypothetical protein
VDDASGLGGLTVADPREERRRRLDDFAQRVADEARTAPIPKASSAAAASSAAQSTTTVRARQTTRPTPAPTAATQSSAATSVASAAVTATPASPRGKFPPILILILIGIAIIGVIAFLNSQQKRPSPAYEEPAPYAPPAESPADPAAPSPMAEAPAPPEDFSYMDSWSVAELRAYAQTYQHGYEEAAARLTQRELDAYYNAQGSFSGLVLFVRNWPGGQYASTASGDLDRLIQSQKSTYSTPNVWLSRTITAYLAPTYDGEGVTFSGPGGPYRTTGTIGNENTTWVEMPVRYDGAAINVYVPQGDLAYSDPNPPPPPAPIPRPQPDGSSGSQTRSPQPAYPASPAPAPAPEPYYLSLNGQWDREPTENEFQRITATMRLRRNVTISVDCQIGSDYRLINCQIAGASDNLTQRQEDGALELAGKYVAPAWADGYQTRYKRTEITFEFRP